ncbi:MAG: hypothetical protein V3U84_06975 [Thiotrichaceae bacterium]
MKPEELQKIKEQFPNTVGVKLLLVPWIEDALHNIEVSWHNQDAARREEQATEKKLLDRLVKHLKLELNPDTPQAVVGNTERNSDAEAGT